MIRNTFMLADKKTGQILDVVSSDFGLDTSSNTFANNLRKFQNDWNSYHAKYDQLYADFSIEFDATFGPFEGKLTKKKSDLRQEYIKNKILVQLGERPNFRERFGLVSLPNDNIIQVEKDWL